MTNNDELLSIRAAELYYEEDKTQDEIGTILRLTRWKVGRLLAQAKANGFIRIRIVHPRARRLGLERRLRDATGLTEAVVVSTAGVLDELDLQKRTAQVAADYLTTLRPAPRSLGISWGRTLHDISERLAHGWSTGVNVVQINGGVSLNAHPGTAAATAVSIAQKGAGHFTLLPSPAILERAETKQALAADRSVAAVLEQGATASAYLFSAGQADEASAHVASGYLTPAQVEVLVQKGAVGDVVGRFINSAGQIVDPELDERTLGIPLEHLRRATTAIAVIGGARKHAIARAVVQSGLCTVLITDEDTAHALLAREP